MFCSAGIGQFPLSIAEPILQGAFEYATDLFDATTIVRMTAHFTTLTHSRRSIACPASVAGNGLSQTDA